MDLEKHQKTFIWKKKYEERGEELDEKEIELINERNKKESLAELERIKERQLKRELEYEQKQRDGEFLQRQKEAQQYEHWEQQEDNFVLRQQRLRSKIRIRDGRAKPIDLFAHYISVFGESVEEEMGRIFMQEEQIDLSDSPIEFIDPRERFNGLCISDLEELEADIKLFMSIDCGSNLNYWRDLLVITTDELAKLRAAKENSNKCQATTSHQSINPKIAMEVMASFEKMSLPELSELERGIKEKISNKDDPSVDFSFWESALSRLRACSARNRIKERHKDNLRKKAEQMSKETSSRLDKSNTKERSPSPVDEHAQTSVQVCSIDAPAGGEPSSSSTLTTTDNKSDDEEDEDTNINLERGQCIKAYVDGRYSPNLIPFDKLELGIVTVDFDEDIDSLNRQRKQVMNATSESEVKLATLSSDERAFLEAARKGMSNEEASFSCEENVASSKNRHMSYNCADKYRPRKPRYFNRVHTGFEWNKYNQTHYDIDNPPPKVVQGYKFNIFYPDLIDRTKTPTYTLTPCRDNEDFEVIRFSAGPPYEDIAFRIVKRKWNKSGKRGFKNQFNNNILQLWFHFERLRYRR